MKDTLNWILDAGIEHVPESKLKQLRLANRLSLVGGFVSVGSLVTFALFGFWTIAPVLLGFAFICALGLILNAQGKPELSRNIQLTAFSLIMLICAYIFGANYGIEYGLLPVVIIAFFFFEGLFLRPFSEILLPLSGIRVFGHQAHL